MHHVASARRLPRCSGGSCCGKQRLHCHLAFSSRIAPRRWHPSLREGCPRKCLSRRPALPPLCRSCSSRCWLRRRHHQARLANAQGSARRWPSSGGRGQGHGWVGGGTVLKTRGLQNGNVDTHQVPFWCLSMHAMHVNVCDMPHHPSLPCSLACHVLMCGAGSSKPSLSWEWRRLQARPNSSTQVQLRTRHA